MKRWLPFIFLLLAAFSSPAITRQFAPIISEARGNVLAEETNGVPYWTLGRPTGYLDIWCDACLRGIHVSRVKILEGTSTLSFKTDPESVAAHIPNFTWVLPDE